MALVLLGVGSQVKITEDTGVSVYVPSKDLRFTWLNSIVTIEDKTTNRTWSENENDLEDGLAGVIGVLGLENYLCNTLSINFNPAPGGSGAINYSNVIWVDSVNGNDGTAVIGRFDKPHLTIQSALVMANAQLPTATNRANVIIRSGSIANAGNITPYDFCDVYCEDVLFTGYFFLSDLFSAGAVDFNWYGKASWKLTQSTYPFRGTKASNIFIEGVECINTGAIFICSGVTVGIANWTIKLDKPCESSQTAGSGFAFSCRNNLNFTFICPTAVKSPHSLLDVRASHSGKIYFDCPYPILTALNVFGGNFKQLVYVSSAQATSEVVFNGEPFNEAPTYLGGISAMIFNQGSGVVRVKNKIYAGQTIGLWNVGAGTIISEGGIESNIENFVNSGSGNSFIKRGILALKSLGSAIRVGFIGSIGNVWLTDVEINSDLVGDCIQQSTSTSKIYMKNVTSESAGVDFVNGIVVGCINQFTNTVSNKPLNANVINELAQGLVIDPLLKTPKN